MAKGAAIKFKSYEDTTPRLLDLLKLGKELKKYDKIVLKPTLLSNENSHPSEAFMEQILKFCLENKNPVADVFIAEGVDGADTIELFNKLGYKNLAEKYSIGLVDLNNAETEEIEDGLFLKFQSIHYPSILKDSFVISISKLSENEETDIAGTLAGMLGAFPSLHYRGFFSRAKSKIRKWPIKYSIHDIARCKMPNFALIDSSGKGYLLAGLPLEVDKQAAKLLGKDWRNIPYLKLIDEQFASQDEPPKPAHGP